jgi:hypothetical protein
MLRKLKLQKLKGKGYLGDLVLNGNVILKWILKKFGFESVMKSSGSE